MTQDVDGSIASPLLCRDAAPTVTYDSCIYNARQLWSLIRDLQANGWMIGIQCDADTRRPGTPIGPAKYLAIVKHDGWDCGGAPTCQRRGDTPWRALAAVVNEILIPAERGFPPTA